MRIRVGKATRCKTDKRSSLVRHSETALRRRGGFRRIAAGNKRLDSECQWIPFPCALRATSVQKRVSHSCRARALRAAARETLVSDDPLTR